MASLSYTNPGLFSVTPRSPGFTESPTDGGDGATLIGTSPGNPAVNANLNFTIAANANGSSTVTVTLTDSGDTSNGGVNTVTKTFTISVAPVNQPPTITSFPTTPFSATEDTSQRITFTVGDVDSNGASEQLTLSVSNGALTVNTGVTNGVTPAQVTGNGTSTVVITAPLTAIQNTLNSSSARRSELQGQPGFQ